MEPHFQRFPKHAFSAANKETKTKKQTKTLLRMLTSFIFFLNITCQHISHFLSGS